MGRAQRPRQLAGQNSPSQANPPPSGTGMNPGTLAPNDPGACGAHRHEKDLGLSHVAWKTVSASGCTGLTTANAMNPIANARPGLPGQVTIFTARANPQVLSGLFPADSERGAAQISHATTPMQTGAEIASTFSAPIPYAGSAPNTTVSMLRSGGPCDNPLPPSMLSGVKTIATKDPQTIARIAMLFTPLVEKCAMSPIIRATIAVIP